MSFYIGNVLIPGPLVLGPMAGVTDLPFRTLCREFGCDYTYTEMVSAKGIKYNNKNTEELITIGEDEHPVAVQLFGSDPEIMAASALKILDHRFDIVDVNMGCPVPKVVNNGEGSALMMHPDKIYEIISTMTKHLSVPVTVKLRLGFDKEHINVVECAKAAEAGGASAVAVHGRTRSAYYSGNADWQPIIEVKKSLHIPVIGNGDVNSPEKAREMIERTGVDAVMVARAARGNPWIFNEIKTYLATGEKIPRPSYDEIFDLIERHMKMMIAYKGEYTGIREMRKHVGWYTVGMPDSASLRRKASLVESPKEMYDILENARKNLKESNR